MHIRTRSGEIRFDPSKGAGTKFSSAPASLLGASVWYSVCIGRSCNKAWVLIMACVSGRGQQDLSIHRPRVEMCTHEQSSNLANAGMIRVAVLKLKSWAFGV